MMDCSVRTHKFNTEMHAPFSVLSYTLERDILESVHFLSLSSPDSGRLDD